MFAVRLTAEWASWVAALAAPLEAVAADEPHGVVGPAVAVGPQPVDRDDAGVLEAAGDLCLQQKTGVVIGDGGMRRPHLL